jgi:undecaprenyl-diphosphatase
LNRKSDSTATLGRRFGATLGTLGPLLLVGLAAAIVAATLFAWLSEEMLEGETRAFDESVRGIIHQHAQPQLTNLMRFVTLLGSTAVLLTLGVCVTLIFLRIKWRHAALIFAITMAGTFLLNAVLKLLFQRGRPSPFFDLTAPSSYSFPSGHAIYSLCFYGTLAALATARMDSHVAQAVVWIIAVMLVIMIGLSRVYLGVHYPSDVLGGYAGGLVWVCTIAIANRLLHRKGEA